MNIKPAPKPCPASGKQQYDTWQEAHDAKAFANYNESVRYSYSLLDKELALAAAKAGR